MQKKFALTSLVHSRSRCRGLQSVPHKSYSPFSFPKLYHQVSALIYIFVLIHLWDLAERERERKHLDIASNGSQPTITAVLKAAQGNPAFTGCISSPCFILSASFLSSAPSFGYFGSCTPLIQMLLGKRHAMQWTQVEVVAGYTCMYEGNLSHLRRRCQVNRTPTWMRPQIVYMHLCTPEWG